MEILSLLKTQSHTNDLASPELIEKVNFYRADPHTMQIKPEFILIEKQYEKPSEEVKEINKKTKEQNHDSTANEAASVVNTEESIDVEPQAKKQRKLENNQNKKKNDKTQVSIIRQSDGQLRLCPFVAKCQKCPYEAECRYSHDAKGWLAVRPAEISDKCYLYELYGECMFGLTCRFGSSHIKFNQETNSYENLINRDKYIVGQRASKIYNVLDAGLKNKLWKRKYDFSLADKIVRVVNDYVYVNRNTVATMKYNSNKNLMTKKFEVAQTDNTKLPPNNDEKKLGPITDEDLIKLRTGEKKKIDWKNKLYLAPLTTVGNLPYRRICKEYGADVTCCEMAMSTNLLTGQASEWALLKRHESEDLFGIQLAGAYPDTMARTCQLLKENLKVDFVDINSGCPIDLVFDKGAGCALMTRLDHFQKIIRSIDTVLDCPVTAKIRTGVKEDHSFAYELISEMKTWGVSMITLHGRTRQQRYSKLADWDYINKCAKQSDPIPLFGCGDILTYHDYIEHIKDSDISGCMIARGALYKPWLFTEIKEQRDWDITAGERFDILKKFTSYGLEHWGSDTQGVETTRRFMLEWLSFLYRYIPIGLLESVPQKINKRPPYFFGRNDLETLLASPNSSDWIKISEMLLGPVPNGFFFSPKHKANAY